MMSQHVSCVVRPLGRLLRLVALLSLATATPAQASGEHYLLSTTPANLSGVLSRHTLTLDQTLPTANLYRVRDPQERATAALIQEMVADVQVSSFELDGTHVIAEVPPGLNLRQSTDAILETVQQRGTVTYFGTSVLNRYADQPATRVLSVNAAHGFSTGTVTVAVIDTGVDPAHPALQPVLVPGYDFTREVSGIPSELSDLDAPTAALLQQSTDAILEQSRVRLINQSAAVMLDQSTDAILETRTLPSAFGHGTMVAGLIHLVAPTAKIMPLKAFRSDGSSTLYDIVRAVYYAADHGARVINMSFSMPTESAELVRAIGYAHDRGVVTVSSAGNNGQLVEVFPAASSKVVGVASTSDGDTRSPFSNYGNKTVTLTAPGESVMTTYPGRHYAAVWGTSFSTALVSGSVALLSRNVPSANVERDADIAVEAIRHAKRLESTLGKGRVDLVQAFLARATYDDLPVNAPLDDSDGDGLPTAYEVGFGLNPGVNDASLDPDGDGRTNLQEYQANSHPRGFNTSLFAEGATGAFFSTRLALVNPTAMPAHTLISFQKVDGTVVSYPLLVPSHTRRTIDADQISGLESAEFSVVVESDISIVTDRTMTWGTQTAYGSHAETALPSATPGPWFLAEGSTVGNFQLFYLVQNPSAANAIVDITFLRPAPAAPLTKSFSVLAHSRTTIWINQLPELAATDVSGIVTSRGGVPIVVERSMYLTVGGQLLKAGQESAGLTQPSTTWYLAEGATGPFFDEFVLIANPDTRAATVEATYLLPTGATVVRTYHVAAKSRLSVWVDVEHVLLADTAVSTTLRSTNGVPVLVERAMWWPGTATTWQEGHASAGATQTGATWVLADGESGGPFATQTYVLIGNVSARAGTALVTLYFEDGTSASRTFNLPASSRFNVDIAAAFPAAAGRRYGAVIESLGPTPTDLVVERAMYGNALGQTWAMGSAALATRR